MMSRHIEADAPANADGAQNPPFVGALLRLCLERVRTRMREAILAAGFTDLHETHFAVFSYPLPHGVRPAELARRLRMSRQATNHLIAQMEALGYLERRAIEEGGQRRVFLTERAMRVSETIVVCLRQLQAEWAAEVGPERFGNFMGVLRHFAAEELRIYSR